MARPYKPFAEIWNGKVWYGGEWRSLLNVYKIRRYVRMKYRRKR